MSLLPLDYAWLAQESGPKMLVEALKLYGTHEAMGEADNPTIMAWAKETGLDKVYSEDAVPWCGLFMAVVAVRAGKTPPENPLWALNWAKFGIPTTAPILGDVLTFKRPSGGHVALYVGEDASAFHVLGGNQADQVNITRIARTRLYKARRPAYRIQPGNVRAIQLAHTGEISRNEA